MATRSGVRGASQLSAAFRTVANSTTVAARRRAREAALEPMKVAAADHLRANGSVVTGALIASLAIGDVPNRRNASQLGQLAGKVLGRFPSKYAHLVEFAVRPHYQPRRFGGIMHPGHPGYPWLRPAFEEQRAIAANVYFQQIAAIVAKAVGTVPKTRRGS